MAVKIAGRYLERATGPGVAWADGIMPIQAGAFWMGRDAGASDEGPMHRVYVRDFWLDRNKATNRELVDYFHRRDGRFTADPGFEDHPAREVSWFGARAYCLWRGTRLPTGRRPPAGSIAAATRGGTSRRTPGARSSGAPTVRPSPATSGRPAPGRPGCRIGIGKLREWTASAYRPYPYLPDDRRARPVS